MVFAIILIILDLLIIILKPVPEAVYSLTHVIIIAVVVLVIWTSRWVSASDFFYNKSFRLWVVPFIITAILITLFRDWDAEIVHVYETLFTALSKGQNPYLEPVIYHRLADGSESYSQFNYPPAEIPVYLLVYILLKQWNYGVLIVSNLIINILVALVFSIKTPDLDWDTKLPYVLLLIVTTLYYSVSTVFLSLIIAGILLLAKDREPTKKNRIGLILAISLGLLAKFFMLPFAAIYFFHKIIEKHEWSYFIDAAVVLLIVMLVIMPFGWFNVVRSTILFNLNLDVRSEVTTYYFNPISALFYFLDMRTLYAPFVIILFLAATIATRHLPLLNRIVLISAFCLLLFPTPEDQYIGSIFGLLILSKVAELRLSSPTIGNRSKDMLIMEGN
ncbi:MAG: hypothetical protein JSV04_15525 [Candidatus Heimdallarchaeota archaeon]|nr:MAG: hypothetical protein JSV04_15525 [Candidatus Heimdallarchaeota archaeon]